MKLKLELNKPFQFWLMFLILLILTWFCWKTTISGMLYDYAMVMWRGQPVVYFNKNPNAYLFAICWNFFLSSIITYTLLLLAKLKFKTKL